MSKAAKGYGTHGDYMSRLQPQIQARLEQVGESLRSAFSDALKKQETEIISFDGINTEALADSIAKFPAVLKPLLIACNVAARAIERDLGIKNLNTYTPRVSRKQASIIADYLRPHLPAMIAIPTLCYLDRVEFVDKEVRKHKGQWEKYVVTALSGFSGRGFQKRKFKAEGEIYEIDAANPTGREKPIEYAVDVKRIEARRDIHKRCDEIVTKADRFGLTYPNGKFGAVIYYPFTEEHSSVRNRLRSNKISSVVFADETETSIEDAAKLLLAGFGLNR